MKKRVLFIATLFMVLFALAPMAFAETDQGMATVSPRHAPDNILDYNNPTTPDTMKTQSASAAGLPASYDLRALGLSTVIKDQAPFGACWSFATMSAMESNILVQDKATGTAPAALPDLSEHQIDYFIYQTHDGEGNRINFQNNPLSDFMSFGQEAYGAVAQITEWNGVADESTIPYANRAGEHNTKAIEGDWTLDADQLTTSACRVTNADYLPCTARFTDTTAHTGYWTDWDAVAGIKKALMTNGAVATAYHTAENDAEKAVYNNRTDSRFTASYVDSYKPSNHVVSIVGWDDDYAAANFNADHQPPGNGAWIIKNSHGTDFTGMGGYLYISYYDQSFLYFASIVVEQPEAGTQTFAYDNNYQYDYLAGKSEIGAKTQAGQASVANVFTATGAQSLKAVSATTTEPASLVTVQVRRLSDAANPESGAVVSEKQVQETYGGYHTIALDTPVTLKKGDVFSVVETVETPEGSYTIPIEAGTGEHKYANPFFDGDSFSYIAKADAGQSYLKTNGSWADVTTLPTWTQAATIYDGQSVTCNYGNAEIKAFTTNAAELTGISVQPYDAAGNKLGAALTGDAAYNLPAGTASATVAPTVDGGTWSLTAGSQTYTSADKIPAEVLTAASDPLTLNLISPRGDSQSQALGFTIAAPVLTYEIHSQNLGWSQGWVTGPATAGTTGKALRAEAVALKDDDSALNLSYRVHVQNTGWTGWSAEGQQAGTTGRALRMEAIQIKADGVDAAAYTVQYRAHIQNFGWSEWKDANTDAFAGTTGMALRLEAVQVRVVAK